MKNKYKVLYEGDINIIDFPTILRNDWLIPKGWYILDNIIDDNNVYNLFRKSKESIIIIDNIHINYNINKKEYKISVIKTNKKLKEGDILEYKKIK